MFHKIVLIVFIVICAAGASAQTNEFSYQGKLNDGAGSANGIYDFEFKLFDVPSGGTALGAVNKSGVQVADGEFTVSLDFGVTFGGSDRYIEIGVRPGGTNGAYQQLLPRQKITSTPYALYAKSAANSNSVGGLTSSQLVQTNDARLSDARTPLAGSSNYIQNTTSQQTASNFNISGNGTVGGTLGGNVLNAITQLNINGLRAFTVNGSLNEGATGTHVASNTFAGEGAGVNTTPIADPCCVNGKLNSFFGSLAGVANIEGHSNAFFGARAGRSNTGGDQNAFFGRSAGRLNTTGGSNSFFGYSAGQANTTGGANVFVGVNAGFSNSTGNRNTAIGGAANVLVGDLKNATAIGYLAAVGASNSLVLGSIVGVNTCDPFETGCESTNVGIGTPTPSARLHVVGGSDAEPASGGYIVIGPTNSLNIAFDNNEIMARNNGAIAALAINADGGDVNLIQGGTGNVGIGTSTPDDKLHVSGIIRVTTLGSAGSTAVCRNASLQLSTCSSSLKYKTNFANFRSGLNVLGRLRPITFDWKEGGMHDLGLGAEDVAAIEPLLVTYNKDGQVEGVKYDRIGMVMINAVKEQQTQIEEQKKRIEALELALCELNPALKVCSGAKK